MQRIRQAVSISGAPLPVLGSRANQLLDTNVQVRMWACVLRGFDVPSVLSAKDLWRTVYWNGPSGPMMNL